MNAVAVPPPAITPQQAFPGPRAFLREEWRQFKGRSREVEDLHDLVLSYNVVVLYAKSGAGKSSLVNAGLLQRLAPDQSLVCRVGGAQLPNVDPMKIRNIFVFNMLASSRAHHVGHQASSDSGTLISGNLGDLPLSSLDPSILVIDQFEEIFTSYPERWRDRAEFFKQLRTLLKNNPQLHILLVIREDHVADLDSYADTMPGRLRIRYHLEPLREDQAIEAIRSPAELCGFRFAEGVLDSLVRDLRTVPVKTRDGTIEIVGEFVEPLHLQVVCLGLLDK